MQGGRVPLAVWYPVSGFSFPLPACRSLIIDYQFLCPTAIPQLLLTACTLGNTLALTVDVTDIPPFAPRERRPRSGGTVATRKPHRNH